MKIALIQFNAGADKEDNVRRALAMVERACGQGAQFVLLPELFCWRGNTRDRKQIAAVAELVTGETCKAFGALARHHKAHILLGSIFEQTSGTSKVYNTSVLVGPQGEIIAKYRKIHLFDARIGDTIIRESSCFAAGNRGVTAQVDEFKAGLSICYDLRFSKQYGTYARSGVNVMTVPSCFTKRTGTAHWEILLRARAIENLSYVLAPAQVGFDARGIEAYGNSMIVAPWGEVLARGSNDQEEIVYGNIDKTEIIKARAILPGMFR